VSCNFKVSGFDFSLFTGHNINGTIVVLVYVDDIVIISNNSIEINCIKMTSNKNMKLNIWGN
jgi:hypothetical protein